MILVRAIFGAKAQVVIGALTLALTVALWVFYSTAARPTVGTVFHVSMYFGAVACYAIIATGLGFRATERVETAVVENIERADTVVER